MTKLRSVHDFRERLFRQFINIIARSKTVVKYATSTNRRYSEMYTFFLNVTLVNRKKKTELPKFEKIFYLKRKRDGAANHVFRVRHACVRPFRIYFNQVGSFGPTLRMAISNRNCKYLTFRKCAYLDREWREKNFRLVK